MLELWENENGCYLLTQGEWVVNGAWKFEANEDNTQLRAVEARRYISNVGWMNYRLLGQVESKGDYNDTISYYDEHRDEIK